MGNSNLYVLKREYRKRKSKRIWLSDIVEDKGMIFCENKGIAQIFRESRDDQEMLKNLYLEFRIKLTKCRVKQ